MTSIYVTRPSSSLFRGGGAIPPSGPAPVIHITDMQTFCRCRRLWNWTSTLRRGLQPAVLPEPLFMGQGIHVGLDYGYRSSVGEESMAFNLDDALRAFEDWVGGSRSKIEAYAGPLWTDHRAQLENNITMGRALLAHYAAWIKRLDAKYCILGTEHIFDLALPRSRLRYGGRMDGLIQDKSNGLIYILEFKTSKYVSDDKMSGTYRSIQATAYTWAAKRIYDQPIVGVCYRVLRKRIPDVPKFLKNGNFSRAKNQKLTVEWIDYCLEAIADQIVEEQHDATPSTSTTNLTNQRRAEVLQQLHQQATDVKAMARSKPNEFFRQKIITRTDGQIREAIRALRVIGNEMAKRTTPTPPMPGFHCGWCRFRDPCDLINQGMDEVAADLIEAEYAPRDYWEGG